MLSPHIDKLLLVAMRPKIPSYLKARSNEQTIEVSHLASQAALLYEKIRYAVDYKEEHLLRRNAMERMLKRKLALNLKSDKIARSLITEFIRACYLPNQSLPERIAIDIQNIIDKYLLLNKAINKKLHAIGPSQYWNRLMSLTATEIERFLFPSHIEDATVSAFYSSVKDRIQTPENNLSINEQNIQIYLACSRSLLKSDEATLFYKLWLMYYPDWTAPKNQSDIEGIAEHFVTVQQTVNEQINNRLGWQLVPKLKNQAIYFSFIKEIAEEHGPDAEQILKNLNILNQEVRKRAQKKYQEEYERIRRSSWRAVIYIFLTKIILAFVLELPYDLFVLEEAHYLPLGINAIFHPLLLFAITHSIKTPEGQNTNYIISGITAMVYNQKIKIIRLRKTNYSRSLLGVILGLIYVAMFLISFGAIILFLQKLDFNIVSGILFLFFLTLVSYFGLRIRYTAKNWQVQADKESPISFLWDFFTLPIIKVGRWLTKKFASINIFVFILDFIIEAPFKLVLEVFEELISFLREKKEEIY